ncbi:glycoside hydrolase [Mesorhizobium sp. M7A.F.Ca.AU.002.06.1.1]|nr:glycoside hydrolase [Mesorhizobium sp. Primo-B]RUU38024.1 glycoside hydrolase [Mesorhizobium sp. Primo-A]RVB65378.1 glycoside hydrolase [Mesorhizobium sp. M7A.F.Ca.CA.002.03.2.1]RVB91107.1 glycoside hydrolase [Mesorhizobium sp. M7A.F.Ca.AU.002.03.1.1]RVB96060.1 glycoside hydrolase [Mesorhizobium sp. M7A.F.Ca.AU.002.04.1.1]RVC02632.1 glycoside hydrolase [Mesorhizobium sp. M7A.F.Ca.AU.002.06.1.1]RVC18811.1 glycoside hydrolase [Mesorhizobium sp. M7A.F.Ca.AU.001.01.1.1]RVC26216.1 glycoside hy
MNKIRSSGRAKSAIAAALAAALAAGGYYSTNKTPPAVVLAVDSLIIPWEGLVLKSHWDRFAKKYDICHGDTLVNGKPVTPGMSFTKEQCHDMLMKRVVNDYYKPLTRCIAGYTKLPVSLQASLLSGAYNFGVGSKEKHKGLCGSRAASFAEAGDYNTACLAMTAFNKAGGDIVQGLVRRREMGDAQRIGEAELCVSGL